MKGLLGEFKDFINRGNVIDLAIAVLIGAAFGAVITSFTENIFGGLIGAIGDLTFTIGEGVIRYGAFTDSIISFLIIAVVIFAVVKGLSVMQNLRRKEEAEEEDEATEIDVLRDILAELRKDA